MDKIYRKISLEQAKNRTKNPLEYYSVDKETNECTRHSDGNSWGWYCVDILIPKTPTNKTEEPTTPPVTPPENPNEPPVTPPEEPEEILDDCSECSPLITWASDLEDILHFDEVELPVTPPTPTPEPSTDVITYYVGRYKNLMMMYHWLINVFIPSIDFYQKCEVSYKSIKVSDKNKIFETATQLFETLPVDDDFEVGTIIGVTSLYNEFISRFTSFETCQGFLAFMNKLLTEGLFAPLSGTTPYIDVEFSLTSENTDFGFMSPLYENWVEKKKYHLGEVVSYLGMVYVLRKCEVGMYDKYEITCELLKDVLRTLNQYYVITDESRIPASAYKLNFGSNMSLSYQQCVLKETDETGILRYYFIQPYYMGEYDNVTKTVTFDTSNFQHWKLYVTKNNELINDALEYTGITESKLISLKRKISSVDDFGEILPFIIKDDNPQNTNGELQYITGVTNEITYEDGTMRGDALLDVEINSLNREDGWTSVASSSITSDMFNNSGFVRFTYLIGCELNSSKNIIPYTGVKYEEVWKYNKQNKTARIEHRSYNFEYIAFTPIDNSENTVNNLDIVNKNPILSKITYYGKELKDIQYLLCPYIKKEELLGIQDINSLEYDMHSGRYVNAIDGYIKRGTAGALEKHQILGEVKTFADLENYRNNFFQI